LLKAYEEEAERKRDMIRRANGALDRLVLIIEAFRRLSRDKDFIGILEDEGLATMPERIATRLSHPRKKLT
jgi:ParB family chromosome partitioning protein